MAQTNLVPNPSFEDTLECPDFPGQVWRAEGWYVAESTPDYFHCCYNSSHIVCGVPKNIYSFRYAATGIAYCGFGTYAKSAPSNFQERIGVELLTSLEVGTRYYVSMKVSSVSSHTKGTNGAHNKLGMLFSSTKYNMNNKAPTNNYAQFYTDSIITDTIGWTIIKGSFIADSAYRFCLVLK